MSLAVADARALNTALKALNKYGGSATWNYVVTPAVEEFGNIITPEVRGDETISVLPTQIEEGWINSGIASADNKVFLVSSQQLVDLGLSFTENEFITYNGDTLKVERDEPYSGGQNIILHRFICSVTK